MSPNDVGRYCGTNCVIGRARPPVNSTTCCAISSLTVITAAHPREKNHPLSQWTNRGNGVGCQLNFCHRTQCRDATTLMPNSDISQSMNQCVPVQTTATSARTRSAEKSRPKPYMI